MKTYNLALIGCGDMGAAHLEDIYYKENIKIKYLCDLNLERAELFKKKYGGEKAASDFKEVIAKEDVDIVICATYPSTHLDILKECIKHKKHLICEKPITTNLKDGEEFVRLVQENPDVKVLIGHILRHNTTYSTVREMISSGAIGKPIIMRMSQNHQTQNQEKYINLIKETSPIIDCGVHYIDVMQWFTDAKVVDVSGVSTTTDDRVPEGKYNYGMITVRLSDGSVGFYEAGWGATMSGDNVKEFIGPKGRIRIIYSKDRKTHQKDGNLIEYYKYPEKVFEMQNIEFQRKPTGAQLDYMIKMIEDGVPAKPSICDVWESFKIAVDADSKIR